MAKVEKIMVKGVGLNENEKKVFDKVQALGKITPNNIEQVANELDKSVASVRSTLARLNKTYGLISSKKDLFNEKILTVYEIE